VIHPKVYNGSEYLNICRVTDITRSVKRFKMLLGFLSSGVGKAEANSLPQLCLRVGGIVSCQNANPAAGPRRPAECPGQARGNLLRRTGCITAGPHLRGGRCRPQLGSLWARGGSGCLPQ
jgi:hypothetical protein